MTNLKYHPKGRKTEFDEEDRPITHLEYDELGRPIGRRKYFWEF